MSPLFQIGSIAQNENLERLKTSECLNTFNIIIYLISNLFHVDNINRMQYICIYRIYTIHIRNSK